MNLDHVTRSHPDFLAVLNYQKTEGVCHAAVVGSQWWDGNVYNETSYKSANTGLLRLTGTFPMVFQCCGCGEVTVVDSPRKIWFLNIGYTAWMNEESFIHREHVSFGEVPTPVTFCQNYECREIVFLYRQKEKPIVDWSGNHYDRLATFKLVDAGFGDFVKKLLLSRRQTP